MKFFLLVGSIVFLLASHSSSALVILQYHHVSNKTPTATSISPAAFESHMEYLEKNKFEIMDIKQLEKRFKRREPLPGRAVIITFDDGYRSVYTEAFPKLKQRGWPFAVFVNTRAHDEKHRHYASWDELREMSKHGATIANHTNSHPHLIRHQQYETFNAWQDRRVLEITHAEKRIKKEMGRSYKLFAYPYGEYDQSLIKTLASMGYLAFGQQSGPVARGAHPQLIPRFPFGGKFTDLKDFSIKVNSIPFPEARVKVTDNNGRVLNNPELPEGVTKPVLRIASPLVPYLQGLACYGSGQGEIKTERKGGVFTARARRPLQAGRSRYNCTAQAGGGRFYWYSQLFIRRLSDGRWYRE